MLTAEQNERLTRTGPGTPGGALMRRYWQPVALSADVHDAPEPVRLLSENLVLFRTADGTPALVAARCPHRGADLSYARLERGALRCLYHGWLVAGDGRCLEMPGEPAGSTFASKVRHTAYPCVEMHGVVFAYLGPGDAPPFPGFPWVDAPESSVWVRKMLLNCNYLQGNEGNCDPQHLSFLHRFFTPVAEDRSFDLSRDLRVADPAPEIEVEDTPFGLRIYAIRAAGADARYVRITNFIMPNNSSFSGSAVVDPKNETIPDNSYYHFHWHVPIDDYNHWKYRLSFRTDGPLDKAYCDAMVDDGMGEDDNRLRRPENRYLQSRDEQSITYTGMGHNFHDHDRFAVESQGVISDRTVEHLGAPDRAVAAMRRVMLRAVDDVEAGRDPVMARRDEAGNPLADLVTLGETVPAGADVREFWRRRVEH
ncbi:MAG TPA: Rieske 2Fe-2S domain-containing protein [Candidatus Lustribacter sp.]|nr:Rieske 2Fe-2S domain-containing protein [Candidatus Lustribacter sp.]